MSEAATGHEHTKLIIIRGNSGSGKSSVARELRLRHGRGCALVEQDHFRRIVLRERDRAGGIAPALIEQTARFALDHGYHVIVEGIMHHARYADMLLRLRQAHLGRTTLFYLDVSFEETVRRHRSRPQADDFTSEEMRAWYSPRDVLGVPDEYTIAQASTLEQTVAFVAATSGLPQDGIDHDVIPGRQAGAYAG